MSEIVGSALSSGGEESSGTTCRYHPAGGTSPRVEITVDRGSAAVAMASFAVLGNREPGIAHPLNGLGDQSTEIGPTFMIRLGDDLVHLMVWGVDDRIAVANRIVDLMRPRMGPSAQSATSDGNTTVAGGNDRDVQAEQTAALIEGVLDGLAAESDRSGSRSGDDNGAEQSSENAALVDEPPARAFAGAQIRVPLVAGLTIVAAEHEPGRGDYEPIVTVSNIMNDVVSTVFSANLPEGTRISVKRDVRREDLLHARSLLAWYRRGDPRVFAGTTSFSVSAAIYQDLKTRGEAQFVSTTSDANPLAVFAELAGTSPDSRSSGQETKLKLVQPGALAFAVLLNEAPVEVPVIHARAVFGDRTMDLHVLDDPDNPLVLRAAGRKSVGRIVRITFPASAPPVEQALKREARIALHGIYFDFGKDTIRPESEAVLRDIAAALAHNPEWKLTIEGHTDNVGDADGNVDLSRRRAEAVKAALVERYRVRATSLMTEGFGASRPSASNETLSGRALNRRVELVRQ